MPSNWNRVRSVDSGFFSIAPLGLPDKNLREKLSLTLDAPVDPAPDDMPYGSPGRREMVVGDGCRGRIRGCRGVAGRGPGTGRGCHHRSADCTLLRTIQVVAAGTHGAPNRRAFVGVGLGLQVVIDIRD